MVLMSEWWEGRKNVATSHLKGKHTPVSKTSTQPPLCKKKPSAACQRARVNKIATPPPLGWNASPSDRDRKVIPCRELVALAATDQLHGVRHVGVRAVGLLLNHVAPLLL